MKYVSYRKHFASILKVDPRVIVGFIPKDGNHINCSIDNMLLIVDLG